jgi:hypothetical protein
MKLLLLGHITGLMLFGCGLRYSINKDRLEIPGTYIRFSQHEYGTEYDTLIITLQNSSANEFRIMRKWKYERVLDDEKIEPEYKRTISSGIYYEEHKILREVETGDVYSFDFRAKILFNGPIKYQKAP